MSQHRTSTGAALFVHADPSATERVRSALPHVEVIDVPTRGAAPDDVRAGVLLTVRYPFESLRSVLDQGVEWVHILGTGVDGFPLQALGDRLVTCSRGASAVPISEWAVTMMLAFEKRLPDCWITRPPEPPAQWHWADIGTLAGRTVGILGLGAIGTAVAERVHPFGSRVMAVRRTERPAPFAGIELVASVQDLVAEADHVVVAAPATWHTVGLVNAQVLSCAKRGLHLVNVARGEIVDDAALKAALDDGRVAAASLDAFAIEPLPAGHWMYDHPAVRVSPHISWAAPGALEDLYQQFFDNWGRWERGESLEHVVNVAEGY